MLWALTFQAERPGLLFWITEWKKIRQKLILSGEYSIVGRIETDTENYTV